MFVKLDQKRLVWVLVWVAAWVGVWVGVGILGNYVTIGLGIPGQSAVASIHGLWNMTGRDRGHGHDHYHERAMTMTMMMTMTMICVGWRKVGLGGGCVFH